MEVKGASLLYTLAGLMITFVVFILILRWGWFQEGLIPSLGRVFDEWINDSQEFIHTKLPRLVVIAIIAFVLSRLLALATSRMIRVAEKGGSGLGRSAEVKTMAGSHAKVVENPKS